MGLDAGPANADSRREHELYRYFKPPTADEPQRNSTGQRTLSANAASSPDTTLTALAQLCAIRLDASRAMISVIDREKQYFIAEATKSLRISDTSKSEVEGDSLWAGCSTVDKAGRLCEKTIDLPVSLGQAPCFTVTDLSTDERFNQLPFVTGPPYFRFYAGTPLTTKKGVNIGSLFIIDDKIRPCLTPEQEEFLGTIARTVMKHMEITSEADEKRKVSKMTMGINAFVEGKGQLHYLGMPSSLLTYGQPERAANSGPTRDSFLVSSRTTIDSSSRSRPKPSPHRDHRSQRPIRRVVPAEMKLKTLSDSRSRQVPQQGARKSRLACQIVISSTNDQASQINRLHLNNLKTRTLHLTILTLA